MADKMDTNEQYFKKRISRFLLVSIICTAFGLLLIGLVVLAWVERGATTLNLAYRGSFIGMILFVTAIALGIISYYQSRKLNRKKWLVISCICISIISIGILCLYFWQYPAVFQKQLCLNGLRNLSEALSKYERENKQYPPADKWCDALLSYAKNNPYGFSKYFERSFKCLGSKEGRSSYAMNPDVTPNSSGDVVWVFDSKGGWNLYGGRELLNCNNHEGKGCNILFSSGKIQFVEKENLNELKWK